MTGDIVQDGAPAANGQGLNGRPAYLAKDQEINPVAEYVGGLPSPRSQKTQWSALKLALSALEYEKSLWGCDNAEREALKWEVFEYPWNRLTRRKLKLLIRRLQEFGYMGNTIQRTLAAVRRVMDTCCEKEYRGTRWEMSSADYHDATKPGKMPKIKANRGGVTGRALTSEEERNLFEACEFRRDGSPEHPAKMARDRALLSLLIHRGMRVHEVVGLNMADFNRQTGRLKITDSKTESGIRQFDLSGPSRMYLDKWLYHRLAADRRRTNGPIFFEVDRFGTVRPWRKVYLNETCEACGVNIEEARTKHFHETGKRIRWALCAACGFERHYAKEQKRSSTQAVREMLIDRCDTAGMEVMLTHDGRRTFATRCLENGLLPYAQEVMGHSDKATTLKYWRYSSKNHEEARATIDQIQESILGLDLEDLPEAA